MLDSTSMDIQHAIYLLTEPELPKDVEFALKEIICGVYDERSHKVISDWCNDVINGSFSNGESQFTLPSADQFVQRHTRGMNQFQIGFKYFSQECEINFVKFIDVILDSVGVKDKDFLKHYLDQNKVYLQPMGICGSTNTGICMLCNQIENHCLSEDQQIINKLNSKLKTLQNLTQSQMLLTYGGDKMRWRRRNKRVEAAYLKYDKLASAKDSNAAESGADNTERLAEESVIAFANAKIKAFNLVHDKCKYLTIKREENSSVKHFFKGFCKQIGLETNRITSSFSESVESLIGEVGTIIPKETSTATSVSINSSESINAKDTSNNTPASIQSITQLGFFQQISARTKYPERLRKMQEFKGKIVSAKSPADLNCVLSDLHEYSMRQNTAAIRP